MSVFVVYETLNTSFSFPSLLSVPMWNYKIVLRKKVMSLWFLARYTTHPFPPKMNFCLYFGQKLF